MMNFYFMWCSLCIYFTHHLSFVHFSSQLHVGHKPWLLLFFVIIFLPTLNKILLTYLLTYFRFLHGTVKCCMHWWTRHSLRHGYTSIFYVSTMTVWCDADSSEHGFQRNHCMSVTIAAQYLHLQKSLDLYWLSHRIDSWIRLCPIAMWHKIV